MWSVVARRCGLDAASGIPKTTCLVQSEETAKARRLAIGPILGNAGAPGKDATAEDLTTEISINAVNLAFAHYEPKKAVVRTSWRLQLALTRTCVFRITGRRLGSWLDLGS